jgi:hypothetical protein
MSVSSTEPVARSITTSEPAFSSLAGPPAASLAGNTGSRRAPGSTTTSRERWIGDRPKCSAKAAPGVPGSTLARSFETPDGDCSVSRRSIVRSVAPMPERRWSRATSMYVQSRSGCRDASYTTPAATGMPTPSMTSSATMQRRHGVPPPSEDTARAPRNCPAWWVSGPPQISRRARSSPSRHSRYSMATARRRSVVRPGSPPPCPGRRVPGSWCPARGWSRPGPQGCRSPR